MYIITYNIVLIHVSMVHVHVSMVHVHVHNTSHCLPHVYVQMLTVTLILSG